MTTRERYDQTLVLRGDTCLATAVPAFAQSEMGQNRQRPRALYIGPLGGYTARAAEKMRRQSLATARLSVFVETNSFKPDDPQYHASRGIELPVATADTGKLTGAAMRALAALWRPGFRYKKAGVMFVDLVRAADVQGGLFDRPDTPATQRLMRAVDSVNGRHGRYTISFASSGRHRAWKLRSEQLSLRYTTSWKELLSV